MSIILVVAATILLAASNARFFSKKCVNLWRKLSTFLEVAATVLLAASNARCWSYHMDCKPVSKIDIKIFGIHDEEIPLAIDI